MPVSSCTHDSHRMRSRRALRMLLQTLLVSASLRCEISIMYAAVLYRAIAAEAAQRPRMRSVMPTSRGHRFASHGPLGCFAVSLIVFPARNSGHWLDTVISDTLLAHATAIPHQRRSRARWCCRLVLPSRVPCCTPYRLPSALTNMVVLRTKVRFIKYVPPVRHWQSVTKMALK